MSIITHLPTQSVLRRRQFESAGTHTHMLIYWPLMQICISNVNERVSALALCLMRCLSKHKRAARVYVRARQLIQLFVRCEKRSAPSAKLKGCGVLMKLIRDPACYQAGPFMLASALSDNSISHARSIARRALCSFISKREPP